MLRTLRTSVVLLSCSLSLLGMSSALGRQVTVPIEPGTKASNEAESVRLETLPYPEWYRSSMMLSIGTPKDTATTRLPSQDATSQNPSPSTGKGSQQQPTAPETKSPSDAAKATQDQEIQKLKDQMKQIEDALKTENEDFALVLGVGSLIVDSNVTDYHNQSNVLQSTNVGRATPQLLTGVSFRSRLPNPVVFEACKHPADLNAKCDAWEQRPWSFFVSLKFSPNSTQILNGYVFGFSYSITKYLNVLIGLALTPINEPAPGFRVAASQFVTNQQKLTTPQDLNFDPIAMLNNTKNAFDGFPLTDASGKLIYQGSATTTHYSGGAVFGISIPIYFKSVFGSK